MKKNHHSLIATLFIAASASGSAFAQFNLGSNGSYGPMNITQNTTLQMPEDGIFHCTTVTISNGATLSFSKNAANTPVHLLATGDIIFNNQNGVAINVGGSSSIGVAAGAGGPGGFDGGQGGDEPGDGAGPGGGFWGWAGTHPNYGVKPSGLPYRGSAGFSTRITQADQTATGGAKYGNSLLIPIIGGSGGGGGKASTLGDSFGGGGGGGAIVIASNTRIICASQVPVIIANGGYPSSGFNPDFGSGSGGAVRLVTPEIVGFLNIRVSPGGGVGPDYGGMGRIRIDAINKGAFQLVGSAQDSISAQYATYGSNMVVFPPDFPTLKIKQVGTTNIAETQVDPVFVLFPAGSAEAQTVRVSVKDFNTTVPLRAVVTPQNGSKASFDFTVDNSAGGATEGTVQVNIPAGVSSRVDVWTR